MPEETSSTTPTPEEHMTPVSESMDYSADDLITGPPESSLQPPTENMEVHHHPDIHHKRKKFREYLLEFLMIFLAVTLGFFAEQIREHISEKSRARELAESMINDLKEDTTQLHQLIGQEKIWGDKVEILREVLDTPFAKISTAQFYKAGYGIIDARSFKRATGTADQLKHSGYLRYYVNTPLPAMLSDYDAAAESLVEVQKLEFNWVDQYIVSFMFAHTDARAARQLHMGMPMADNPELIGVNNQMINEFLNHLGGLQALNRGSSISLNMLLDKANSFIAMLQKQYDL